MIVPAAVLFDLDDTLFDQRHWLDGAWDAVARRAVELCGGVAWGLADALRAVSADGGSAQGGIIDRAVASCGLEVAIAPLVDAFRTHEPDRLEPYPGVRAGLPRLAATMPIGIVTDGDCGIQQGKLAALGLGDCLSAVVLSDSLGRAHRKPDPAPFRAALDALGADPVEVVFVGDNPLKDVAGAAALGMTTIRVRTGEYGNLDGPVRPDVEVADAAAAIELLLSWRSGRA